MGDILHALPAVTALRRAHPGWRIDWVVEPKWLPLLSTEPENADLDADRTPERPIVDQIFLAPTKHWGRAPLSGQTRDEVGRLRQELRAGEYDAVLDLQGSVKSAMVAKLPGARRVIGSAEPWEWAAKLMYSEKMQTTAEHVIEQDVELAQAVAGDLLKPVAPKLPRDEDAEAWCDEMQELSSGHPVMLLHPGGGWGAKLWPADRYGAVAEEFVNRGGVVLVNCGPGEEPLARTVVEASGGKARTVGCSLERLVALTRRVSIVVGGDTGPLHLACALGKPVVGIYGPTDPKRNGPYGSRFRVLRNPESRVDHSRREDTEAGLLTITPDAVMSAVLDLMIEDGEARKREQAYEVQDPREARRDSGRNPDRDVDSSSNQDAWGKKQLRPGTVWEARR